jgi:hypothetical protein
MALLLLASLGVSCGGDDGGGDENEGGRGNNAGNSGGGMIEGDGIPCGTKRCTMPEDSMVEPCCRDAFASECGMRGGFGGDACVAIVAMDARCPAVMTGPIMLPSCCDEATNMCGINAEMFGMPGCIELGMAAQRAMDMAMMFGGGEDGGMPGMPGGGFMVNFPPPQACE